MKIDKNTLKRFSAIRKERKTSGYTHVCAECHTKIIPEKKIAGSFAVELIVWIIALLLAGVTFGISILLAIIYSVRRYTGAKYVCPRCGSTNIVPKDSPRGRRLASTGQKAKKQNNPGKYTVTRFKADLKKYINDLTKPPIKKITISPETFSEMREEVESDYYTLENFSDGLRAIDDLLPDYEIHMMSVADYLSTDDFLQRSNHPSLYKMGKAFKEVEDVEWCCEDEECDPGETLFTRTRAIQPLIDAGFLVPPKDIDAAKAEYVESAYKADELRNKLKKKGLKTSRYKTDLVESAIRERVVKVPDLFILDCEKLMVVKKEIADEYIQAAQHAAKAFGLKYLEREILDYALEEAQTFFDGYEHETTPIAP